MMFNSFEQWKFFSSRLLYVDRNSSILNYFSVYSLCFENFHWNNVQSEPYLNRGKSNKDELFNFDDTIRCLTILNDRNFLKKDLCITFISFNISVFIWCILKIFIRSSDRSNGREDNKEKYSKLSFYTIFECFRRRKFFEKRSIDYIHIVQ